MIEDLQKGKPIRLIYDGDDFGIYTFNKETRRYEGIIGYLTIDTINDILNKKITFMELRRIEDE
jgi:hypothetical protein